MKAIGLFYGTSTVKTAKIADKIKKAFGDTEVNVVPIEEAWEKDFEKYDNLIVGTATWFDGELPTYWDEIMPELESLKLKGKKIAIFGLGDQVKYPDNFVDAIGILAGTFEKTGAKIIGLTSPDGYKFNESVSLRDGKLLGLALDIENQSGETDKRIEDWVKQLKKEFE